MDDAGGFEGRNAEGHTGCYPWQNGVPSEDAIQGDVGQGGHSLMVIFQHPLTSISPLESLDKLNIRSFLG